MCLPHYHPGDVSISAHVFGSAGMSGSFSAPLHPHQVSVFAFISEDRLDVTEADLLIAADRPRILRVRINHEVGGSVLFDHLPNKEV